MCHWKFQAAAALLLTLQSAVLIQKIICRFQNYKVVYKGAANSAFSRMAAYVPVKRTAKLVVTKLSAYEFIKCLQRK